MKEVSDQVICYTFTQGYRLILEKKVNVAHALNTKWEAQNEET